MGSSDSGFRDAVDATLNPDPAGAAGGVVDGDALVLPGGTRYPLHVDPDSDHDDDLYDMLGDLNLNEVALRHTQQPPRLPGRPAASAAKAAWIDYCVALGADRAYLQGATWHYDPEWDPDPGNPDVEHYTSRSPLTRDELIALADRLGG